MADFFVHSSSFVDEGAEVGSGTRIWHFSHVMPGAVIGNNCNLGQNVFVSGDVTIGNNVKIQNNVSVYAGVHIEDDVFLGPSCVFTNVTNPRAQINRHSLYEQTRVRRGTTIGANATVVCGTILGRYCFIAAGAVVTEDVADYALVMGVPARQYGWMSRHGHRLRDPDTEGIMTCPESEFRYRVFDNEAKPLTQEQLLYLLKEPFSLVTGRLVTLRCLDIDEEAPLPERLKIGTRNYSEYRK